MAELSRLYDLSHAQLEALMAAWEEPRYRADQIWRWLYRSLVASPEEMQNLPGALRARLAAETLLALLEPIAGETSASQETQKTLFRLRDGNLIESVLMHYHDRTTACISTQAGCGMGCTFCATGQGGLARNLSAGEIVAQVVFFARELRAAALHRARDAESPTQIPAHPVSHVVLMGMGEPLANYGATWQAIKTLTDDRGYGLGARRITLSTVGLVPGIWRLSEETIPINLAVSLHAPDDALRNELVPVGHRYPLSELMSALRDYVDRTGRRITIEYALIAGVNDSAQQASQLSLLVRDLLCHVNLIPLNPTPGSSLLPSSPDQVAAFQSRLEAAGIPTTTRLRRGLDIQAGCGQLRQRAGSAEG